MKKKVPTIEEMEAALAVRHTPEVAQKLKASTVGIAGLGGLGSAVAVALARVGVGKLILVDFDVVDLSNLNRQHYFLDQIGQKKCEALAENLRRINPYLKYETHSQRINPQNVSALFDGVDVLLEAFDAPDQKAMLLQNFTQAPLVCASGMAGYDTATTIRQRKMGKQIYAVGDFKSDISATQSLMAPRVGIVAHWQANLVVRILLGAEGKFQ